MHRMSITLGPRGYNALARLREDLEAASIAEVLRTALTVTAKLTREAKDGGRVLVRRPNGEEITILLVPVVGAVTPLEEENRLLRERVAAMQADVDTLAEMRRRASVGRPQEA